MSIPSVSSSSQLSAIQSNFQQLRKQFTQLGQDLSSGSLSKAQTDFVTLSQAAAAQLGSNSPVSQALNTIGQALQSGNLSGAQRAFAALPGNFVGPNAVNGHSHVHHGQGDFRQALNQLGQALQSGNLTAAQQAFAAMQQNWPQIMGASGTAEASPSSTAAAAAAFSVSA
jgi:hypothetical protein